DQDRLSIVYPRSLWLKYPVLAQKSLSENLAFALTFHLPFISGINQLQYQMERPQTSEIIKEGFKCSLPSTAMLKSEKTSELLKKFSAIQYHFDETTREDNAFYPFQTTKPSAVSTFTFGKDSLLTLGLCQELGIKPHPVFVKEPLTQRENVQKEKLAKQFEIEFKEKILFINNEVGMLRETYKDKHDEGWYGWELQLTHFGMILLPVIFAKKARYMFFSNEQSCNDKFRDAEGFWCNPVYEQSAEWMSKMEEMAKMMGMEDLKIASLVEPIHEIAVVKILNNRYPQLAKYQMSCGEDRPGEDDYRWCESCSKCARNYIFLLANKVDPKKVGIKNSLLDLKHKNKYSLFESCDSKDYGYDSSGLGRDEQLLAFFLAYKNGYRGQLINLFKKNYLEEARAREKELKAKFFGIHPSYTIPEELKDKVLEIFKNELSPYL
ncbi:MAG: hypothetical protein Q7S70_02280, partial [bacterium]|nr:hypothetical protein [bacterium]